MKRSLLLVLGGVVVLLAAAGLIVLQGGGAGWDLGRLGLGRLRPQTAASAPPSAQAQAETGSAAQNQAPSAQPPPADSSPPASTVAAAEAPAAAPAPPPAQPLRPRVDRTSNAYVCAHGDPTDSRTIAACDRKDWAATERANR